MCVVVIIGVGMVIVVICIGEGGGVYDWVIGGLVVYCWCCVFLCIYLCVYC